MRVKMNQMEKSHKDAMELQQVGNYICTSNMSQSACRKFGEKCTTGVKKKKNVMISLHSITCNLYLL